SAAPDQPAACPVDGGVKAVPPEGNHLVNVAVEPIFHLRISGHPAAADIPHRPGLGVDPVQIVQIVHDKMAQNQSVGFQNNLHFPDLLSENFALLPSPPEIPTRSAKIKKPREKPAANLPSVEIERRLLIPAAFSASSPESLPPLRGMEVRKASLPDGDNPYSTPNCSSRRSVINMCPGAWVIMRSGFTSIATAWGVTPQAQKTGTSPSRIVTGSPKSGRLKSRIPIASGFPICTGAPWTAGKREVTWTARTTCFSGMGRMLTTIGPLNRPAGTHGMLVLYMGTLQFSSIWRT